MPTSVAADRQNIDTGAALSLFGADRDDDMVGTLETERPIGFETFEASAVGGNEMQFVSHALERRAEPRHGDRTQLGKRPKLRLDACDDGIVDGVQAAVRAM